MSTYIKRIILIIVLLGLVVMGVFSYFIYNTLLAPNTAFKNERAIIYVHTPSSYQEVFSDISPLLKKPNKFDLVARQKKYINHIRPGRYVLTKGMNNNDIINTLRTKNYPVSVIFNNQNSLSALAHRISTQIEADSSSLMKVFTDTLFLEKNGFTPNNSLELYLPNKYEFYWNTSAEQFRSRMLKEYQKFWKGKRTEKAKSIGLTPQEVSTLASVVQKETSISEEQRKVAGVYLNRLRKGMKLEADPTVIYAIKQRKGIHDTTVIKRVLYKDLEIDSPYNTYRHRGLPPGPICMPDLSTIDAVLNYDQNDYIYFVADPSRPGHHKFSKTLSQHNRNKAAYINWLKKKGIRR